MAYFLRTCKADGTAYGGFQWPLEVGAVVEAPDWNPMPECGNGLHGLLNGGQDGCRLSWKDDALWMVVEADEYVDIDNDKCKFPRCTIVAIGDRKTVTDFLVNKGFQGVHGAYVITGDKGISISGDYGTSNSRDKGNSTSGKYGNSTSGKFGTSTSGYKGTSLSGDHGTSKSGEKGTSTSGYNGTSISGNKGTSTSGFNGTSTSGDYGTSISGFNGTSISGDNGISTSGHYGTSTSGDEGTSTSGDEGTSTSGDNGTSIAGRYGKCKSGGNGRLEIEYVNKGRRMKSIAYVGQRIKWYSTKRIKPDTFYQLDPTFKFIECK